MNAIEIKDILRRYICVDIVRQPNFPLLDETSLVQGGLIDSFVLVDVTLFMETTFDIHLAPHDLSIENMDTLNDMADLVIKARLAKSSGSSEDT